MTSIRCDRHHTELLEWLQENVGDLLWSSPILEWHGEGWHVNIETSVIERGRTGRAFYLVEIEDPRLATLFALWT